MEKHAILSRVVLVVTLAALTMAVVGFCPQRWITATFQLPMTGAYLKTQRPVDVFTFVEKSQMGIFINLNFSLNVTSTMGLYKNCKDISGEVMGISLSDNVCDHDGAMTWQYISFGTAVSAIFFGTISLVMTSLGVLVKIYKTNLVSRFAIVVVNFLAGCSALCPVFLYANNKRIQVRPPLPTMVTFELDWALYLTLASAGVFGLASLLNTYIIVELSRGEWNRFSSEDSLEFSTVSAKENKAYQSEEVFRF